jgi:hypothetical protein
MRMETTAASDSKRFMKKGSQAKGRAAQREPVHGLDRWIQVLAAIATPIGSTAEKVRSG